MPIQLGFLVCFFWNLVSRGSHFVEPELSLKFT